MEKGIALITGANRGIGLETARQLGQLGFHVIVGARDLVKAVAASERLKDEGSLSTAVALNVNSSGSILAAYNEISGSIASLDILINNAGVLLDQSTPTAQADLEAWRETLETNVLGTVAVTTTFLPLLHKAKAARIVNVSSILGSLASLANTKQWPDAWASGSGAYRVSKAAVNMYTLSLAADLAKTLIKVNAAHPGWVQTDMGGCGAPLSVEQGAKTLVQLATLNASGPTGGFFHMGKRLDW
ncbi:MAG: SDR family oxidoreductase [Deltaproteobacteria bacterium]|nr:SDR family oxidoreductase [Deltaproteobacteria bacterium]MBI3293621.1 SDR family oxidoreductase [Deltaproteobacteria bacterium]